MMVIDVSGSMQETELEAAFNATTATIEALFLRGANSCLLHVSDRRQ